jgi:hypothetical protein
LRQFDDLDLLTCGALVPLRGFGESSTGLELRAPTEVVVAVVAAREFGVGRSRECAARYHLHRADI